MNAMLGPCACQECGRFVWYVLERGWCDQLRRGSRAIFEAHVCIGRKAVAA